MKIFKIIALAFAGGLLVVLAIFCQKVSLQDGKSEKLFEKWQDERRDLDIEYRKIETKLEDLENEFSSITSPKATSQIIFTDLDEKVYTKAYPLMANKGYVGTLVFSKKQLPGENGCITKKQCEELLKKGWSVCVQWEEASDVKTWWEDWGKELQKQGIQSCQGVYFPQETYDEALDTELKEINLNYVIVEKDEKRSPLQKNDEEGLWHVGAIGCMTSQPKKWLKEAVVQHANVSYLVSFSIEHQIFESDTFERMLNSFDELVKSEELTMLNVEEARKYRENYLSFADSDLTEKYLKEKSKLEKKLEEVQSKLDEIDAKYQ